MQKGFPLAGHAGLYGRQYLVTAGVRIPEIDVNNYKYDGALDTAYSRHGNLSYLTVLCTTKSDLISLIWPIILKTNSRWKLSVVQQATQMAAKT